MSQSQHITFHYLNTSFTLKNRTALKYFIAVLIKSEKKKLNQITYVFCTDDDLLPLNKSYLNHNTLTDIITFELSEKDEPLLADIYISIDRVRENAKLFNSSFLREIHRVIFHGALHLCGYKDKTQQDAEIMRKKENYYLNQYFVSRETL